MDGPAIVHSSVPTRRFDAVIVGAGGSGMRAADFTRAFAIELDPQPAVTVVMASAGYPGAIETGKKISGLEDCAKMENVQVFHAGTRAENGDIVTNGGRVLAVTALGADLAAARDLAYAAVNKIDFEGCHYRRDIALAALPANVGGTDVASRTER